MVDIEGNQPSGSRVAGIGAQKLVPEETARPPLSENLRYAPGTYYRAQTNYLAQR